MSKNKDSKMPFGSFSSEEGSVTSKAIYGIVAGIIIVCALVVGLVSSANRKKAQEIPPTPSEKQSETPSTQDEKPNEEQKPQEEAPITFRAPTVGTIGKSHSDTVPVWSVTLEEYRTHQGIDITTEDGAAVCAAAAGVISKIDRDPLLGMTVEITHNDALKTVYQNLNKDSVESLTVGQTVNAGEVIGCVGDSSISELCDEPHLHFEVLAAGKSVNPLDYISEASKKEFLGITPAEIA